MPDYIAVSLFSGAGGLDMGFSRNGFRTILAVDNYKDALETFHRWNPSAKIYNGDVKKLSISEIPSSDIILGGFPCQGFSLGGCRREDDKRNSLYLEYVRILKGKLPKAFIGENVKGLTTMGKGKVMEIILNDFSECGYRVFYKLLNASDYGVPQDRERVILVGFRKDLGVEGFEFPKPLDRKVTLREVLRGMPEAEEKDICMQPFSPRFISRNRKRGWDSVSYTIPAMAKQVPLHPSSPDMIRIDADHFKFGEGRTRRFSWREAAVVQTFPRDLEFSGNLISKYKQIGNAVPVKLAEAVARRVREVLSEKIL